MTQLVHINLANYSGYTRQKMGKKNEEPSIPTKSILQDVSFVCIKRAVASRRDKKKRQKEKEAMRSE